MFKGQVTNWTSVADTDIPFTTTRNTNDRITNNNGLLSINTAGNYNVDGCIVVTGVTGNVTATIFADGVATNNSCRATLDLATDVVTIPIVDVINVIKAQYPNVGTISVRLSKAGATVNGILRVEYVR